MRTLLIKGVKYATNAIIKPFAEKAVPRITNTSVKQVDNLSAALSRPKITAEEVYNLAYEIYGDKLPNNFLLTLNNFDEKALKQLKRSAQMRIASTERIKQIKNIDKQA